MEKLKAGRGELFMTYDADESRHFFKDKNKKLVNKLTTVPEAVKKHCSSLAGAILTSFSASSTIGIVGQSEDT